MKRFFRRIGRLALRIFAWTSVSIVGLTILGHLIVYLWLNYWPSGLHEKDLDFFLTFEPPKTMEILDKNGNSLITLPGIEDWEKKIPEYRKSVHVGELPEVMRHAILAAEDQRFFSHNGLDYWALLRAEKELVVESILASVRCRCMKIVIQRGASTLTQQVVRLVLLKDQFEEEQQNHTSKWPRKISEMRYAPWLEHSLLKRIGNKELIKSRIFQMYLEMSYMGHGQYGLASGAEFYFGKPLSEIKLYEEAALLAGIIRSPSRYSPRVNRVAAEGRRNRILALMKDIQNGSDEEFAKYTKTPITLAELPQEKSVAPSAVNFIIESNWGSKEHKKITWVNGTTVTSTIQREWQIAANEAVEYNLNLYRERHPEYADKVQSAMVVMQNTGEIRAMVGGSGVRYISFNRARALRQPGSAIKPLVYLAALEQGWPVSCTRQHPNCEIMDSRISVSMGQGKYHEVHNYDGRYYDRIQLWQGSAESRNAATMWLFRNIIRRDGRGYLQDARTPIEILLDTAQGLGLYEGAKPYPTLAIGAEVITPLALTAFYAAFANGGYRIMPRIVDGVLGPDGAVLELKQEVSKQEQIMTPEIAKQMMQLLRHTILWRSGTGRSLSNLPDWEGKIGLPFEVIGKTGTTNNFRDAWFCGSTYGNRGITACVWVGMDDNTSLTDPEKCKPLDSEGRKYCESGAAVALPAFKKFVETIYADHPPEPFPAEVNEAVLAAHKYGKVLAPQKTGKKP